MPLDFLKRRNTTDTPGAAPAGPGAPAPVRGHHAAITLPEEVVAQESGGRVATGFAAWAAQVAVTSGAST